MKAQWGLFAITMKSRQRSDRYERKTETVAGRVRGDAIVTSSPEEALSEFSDRLDMVAESLTGQLRKAARYILDQPEEVALKSLRQLARAAGVTPSTMSRLARALRYESYAYLRASFQTWLRSHRVTFADRVRRIYQQREGKTSEDFVHDVVVTEIENLHATADALSPKEVCRAAKLLMRADRVFVLGLRSLFGPAQLFHYACSRFTDKVILLSGIAGTMFDPLRLSGPKDVMVVMASNLYARDAIRAAQYAVKRGARLVVITDSRLSPLARRASLLFLVKTSGVTFVPSVLPVLLVIQALVGAFLAEIGPAAKAELKRTEQLLDYFEVFLGERELEPGG